MFRLIAVILCLSVLNPTSSFAHGGAGCYEGPSIVRGGSYTLTGGNCASAVRVRSTDDSVQIYFPSGYVRDYFCSTDKSCYDSESQTTLQIKSRISFVIAGSFDGIPCNYSNR